MFFVFKFVVLFLVVRGGTVYLPKPPPWLDVVIFNIYMDVLYQFCEARLFFNFLSPESNTISGTKCFISLKITINSY